MIPFMRTLKAEPQREILTSKHYPLHEVTLMTVDEVIEAAFQKNHTLVNFRLIEVVLLVLANKLRVLDRKVAIALPSSEESIRKSSVSLREIKVRTRPQSAKLRRKKSARKVVSKTQKVKKNKEKEAKQTSASKRIHQIFPTTSQQAMKGPETPQATQVARGQQTEQSSTVSVVSRSSSVKKIAIEKSHDPYEHLKSERSELLRQIYHPAPMPNVDVNVPKAAKLHKRVSQGDFKSSYERKTSELAARPQVTTSRRALSTTDESWVQTIGSRNFFSETSFGVKADAIEKKTPISFKTHPLKKKPETEKIIIVEFPSENFESPFIYETERKYSPQSMVTTDQLNKMAQEVSQLEERFSQYGPTEGNELLEILHKRSSMSSPVSMLQLSVKLEAVESTSNRLYNILHHWMSTKNTRVERPTNPATFEEASSFWEPTREKPFTFPILPVITCYARAEVKKAERKESGPMMTYVQSALRVEKAREPVKPKEASAYCQSFFKEMMNIIINRAYVINDVGGKVVQSGKDIINRLQYLFSSADIIDEIQAKISMFSEKMDTYESKLSQEMSNYQEELAGMQHQMLMACDNLAEYIMNMKMDSKDVEELHMKYNVFHYNIDETSEMQNGIKINQNQLASDVAVLWNKYQKIKKDKYDRHKLMEALATKAGFENINKFMTFDNYYAVFGHLHSAIERCLAQVHCTEIMWQRNLDELFKNAFNKAEVIDIKALEEDFDNHVAHILGKVEFMISIARRDKDPTIAQKHDKPCVSCGSKPNVPPKTKHGEATSDVDEEEIDGDDDSLKKEEVNSLKKEEVNKAKTCFFARPVPRNHHCPRPCSQYYKAPTLEENIIVTKVPIMNAENTSKEADHKTEKKNKGLKEVPCLPCSSYSQPRIIRISKMPKRYIGAAKVRIQAPSKKAENVPGSVEKEGPVESKNTPRIINYY